MKIYENIKKTSKGMFSNQAGLTLLELLVVIVILGILAGISFQAFSGQGEDARAKAHATNVTSMENAAERYDLEVGFVNGDYTIVTNSHPLVTEGYLKEEFKNPWADTTQTFAGYKYAITKDSRGIFYAYLVDATTPTGYVTENANGETVSKAPAAGAGNINFVTPATGATNPEDRVIN